MATRRLIQVNTNGTKQEYTGVGTSAGVSSADEIPKLGSDGRLDTSFMPVGVGVAGETKVAGEALSAGDFVYFDGTSQVMKADATAIGKQARGYVNSSALSGANVLVFYDDLNTGLTGLTPNATYYLDTVAGGVITPAPTPAVGQIVQAVGYATSPTVLKVDIEEAIIRT